MATRPQFLIWMVAVAAAVTQARGGPQCEEPQNRVDCGSIHTHQQDCEAQGCCWRPVNPNPTNLPWCFKPENTSLSCFNLLSKPLSSAPFDDGAVKKMMTNFIANIDVNGTGAVVASPGAVPALKGCCPGGYKFHWMRDGALSMMAVQKLSGIPASFVNQSMQNYIRWVERMQAMNSVVRHTEPKWVIANETPYAGGWCRPQTDGPGLRAKTLMYYAAQLRDDDEKAKVWRLIRDDLDWVAEQSLDAHPTTTCDLWEETTGSSFLWNRATMRAGLVQGAALATALGDTSRHQKYTQAAQKLDPLASHIASAGGVEFATECPATADSSPSCKHYDKLVDGAVILALTHSGWGGSGLVSTMPTNQLVAETVQRYNAVFCAAYDINRADSDAGVPGVLYGRYALDQYGGGNPWQLITAALATLFYQAAQHRLSTPLTHAELQAWQSSLGPDFTGNATAFVAAGDAVLARLSHHIQVAGNTEVHVFEQMDRVTGAQYNAKDLTWSYAELLSATQLRQTVLESI